MARLYSLRLLFLLAVAVLSEPAPARVPKVYNALITSNQNLEPSKAYPVYQPVIHDTAFAFPFSSVYYGSEFPLNGFGPLPAPKPKVSPPAPPSPSNNPSDEKPEAPAEVPPAVAASDGGSDKAALPADAVANAPPLPPNTESPIPLNQFGLPPQVFPFGRFDPAFNGFTQVGPYYSYPSFKFYDPYDPFSLNPYGNLPPLYRPLTNVLNHGPPNIGPAVPPNIGPAAPPRAPEATPVPEQGPSPSESSLPSEPSDLNVLNYSSKDPSIPNVEPPPLPSGATKDAKSE